MALLREETTALKALPDFADLDSSVLDQMGNIEDRLATSEVVTGSNAMEAAVQAVLEPDCESESSESGDEGPTHAEAEPFVIQKYMEAAGAFKKQAELLLLSEHAFKQTSVAPLISRMLNVEMGCANLHVRKSLRQSLIEDFSVEQH